jgi:hypothetical protein
MFCAILGTVLPFLKTGVLNPRPTGVFYASVFYVACLSAVYFKNCVVLCDEK